MLALSAGDVNEDDIEKADTVLAGLAFQHADNNRTHVTIFVSDSVAEQAIVDVLSATDVGNRVLVLDGREFIQQLVDN